MQPAKEVRAEALEKLQEIFEFFRSCQHVVQIRPFASEDLPARGFPWPTTMLFVLVIGPHVADVKDQAA